MRKFFSLFLLVFLLFLSCSESPSGLDDLAFMEITDATTLFIAPGDSTSRNARNTSGQNRLFKITEDGYVEEVIYYDENGGEMTVSNTPVAVYNLTEEYIGVFFGYDEIFFDSGYLVRKTDGAVFLLGMNSLLPLPIDNSFKNIERIQMDYWGNLYYLTYSDDYFTKQIRKVDTSNPNSLTSLYYSPDTDNIESFFVTQDSHVVYDYWDDTGSYSRIKKSNGGLYNLSYGFNSRWIGLDGKIKFLEYNSTDYIYELHSVDIDDNYNVSFSKISDYDFDVQCYDSFFFQLHDRTYIIDGGIHEMENPANTPRSVSISQIDNIKLADASDEYYFLSGTDSTNNPLLLKVNPLDDSVTILLDAGLYDPYKMTVSSDNHVYFSALRMQDGAKILGEIDSTGTVTILDETINSEITVLERIK